MYKGKMDKSVKAFDTNAATATYVGPTKTQVKEQTQEAGLLHHADMRAP